MAQKITTLWETIKSSEEFDQFDLGKIRDQVYCSNVIANIKKDLDTEFSNLERDSLSNPVLDEVKISQLEDGIIKKYSSETKHCEKEVKESRFKELQTYFCQKVQIFKDAIDKLQTELCNKIKSKIMDDFKPSCQMIENRFEGNTDWDLESILGQFQKEIIESYYQKTALYLEKNKISARQDLEKFCERWSDFMRSSYQQKKIHQSNLNELNVLHQSQIEEQRRQFNENNQRQEEEHRRQLDDAIQQAELQHKSHIEQMRQQYLNEKAELNEEFRVRFDNLAEEGNQKLNELQLEHNSAMQTLQQRFQNDLEQLNIRQQQESKQYEANIQSLQKQFTEAQRQLEEEKKKQDDNIFMKILSFAAPILAPIIFRK